MMTGMPTEARTSRPYLLPVFSRPRLGAHPQNCDAHRTGPKPKPHGWMHSMHALTRKASTQFGAHPLLASAPRRYRDRADEPPAGHQMDPGRASRGKSGETTCVPTFGGTLANEASLPRLQPRNPIMLKSAPDHRLQPLSGSESTRDGRSARKRPSRHNPIEPTEQGTAYPVRRPCDCPRSVRLGTSHVRERQPRAVIGWHTAVCPLLSALEPTRRGRGCAAFLGVRPSGPTGKHALERLVSRPKPDWHFSPPGGCV